MNRSLLPLIVAAAAGASAGTAAATPHNVLFIVVDDMRPNIGAFNFSLAHTPHMDALAASGLAFRRAYVQYAFCAPSRNSFMSGRRPDTTRVWNFMDHFREQGVGEHWQSLPEYFKNHGMVTAGSGKLYHPRVPPDNDWPKSWTTDEAWSRYYSPECMPPTCPHSTPPRNNTQDPDQPQGVFHCLDPDPRGLGPPATTPAGHRATSCPANTSKDERRFAYQLEDQRIRDSCTDQLEALAAQGKGFFLGCGFHKPHVPWEFPAKFLLDYPPRSTTSRSRTTHLHRSGCPTPRGTFPGTCTASTSVSTARATRPGHARFGGPTTRPSRTRTTTSASCWTNSMRWASPSRPPSWVSFIYRYILCESC